MLAEIRKVVVSVEETCREAGQAIDPATRKAIAAAVVANPFAGEFQRDLTVLMKMGEELGRFLGVRAVQALHITPDQVESYGKAAIVGERGELEHAAAILHPQLGAPLRAEAGGGAALVPSAKKRGGPGTPIDIPLGHKDAAFVRSHFDAVELRIVDAPTADEILVAIALTDSGRPLARIGGLEVGQVIGKDGLR